MCRSVVETAEVTDAFMQKAVVSVEVGDKFPLRLVELLSPSSRLFTLNSHV